jgi:hypothetical protein
MSQTRIFSRLNRGKRADLQPTSQTERKKRISITKISKVDCSSDTIQQFINDFRFSIIKNLNTRKNPNKSGILQVNDKVALFLKNSFKISNRWSTTLEDIFSKFGVEKAIFRKESDKSQISMLNFQCKIGNQRKSSYFVKENGRKVKKTSCDSPKFHWKFTRNTLLAIDQKRKNIINKSHEQIFSGIEKEKVASSISKITFLVIFRSSI